MNENEVVKSVVHFPIPPLGRTDLVYFHKGDLVVIMWSSSLRDHVHFLPKGEWISWSIKELTLLPHKFFESYKFGDDKYNSFLEDYKRENGEYPILCDNCDPDYKE